MEHFKYLIVGGGMAADSAVAGIRGEDGAGSIGVIAAENDPPYDRPPLSKALWKGTAEETIWRKNAREHATLRLGRRIAKIDKEAKQAFDDAGNAYSWEKLLLATGGTPRRLGIEDSGVIYYRTVADYRRLRETAQNGQRFAVIGGGFIGSEVAAALAQNGKEVTMIFPGADIGQRVYPKELSQFLSRYYQEKGVRLLAGTRVTGLGRRGAGFVLKTAAGQELEADGVVAGIGIEPDLTLAKETGLKTGNGIVVDEQLRSSSPEIYAAGDAAEFYQPALGRRLRVEHEDNANTMGKMAGQNMAGAGKRYDHLPMFYSDLFDLGYEAVGELDARLETFADWKQPNREGTIYYLREGRVRGVLLWNVWGQVDAARELIAAPGPFSAGNLKGRLK